MSEQSQEEIDKDAILGQIAAYRVQRDIAMNDVAILSGQLESWKKKYGKLEAALALLSRRDEAGAQEAAPDAKSEGAVS